MSHGYTIAYPVGWHVDGEDVDWNQYPSDDFACRLFGPNPFVDSGLGGWDGWVAMSAQAHVAMQLAPHLGFGPVLFQDQGYFHAAELAAFLATEPTMSVTTVGDGSVPVWKADGWVGESRVYGYIVEPWAACHPILIGTAATDEALVVQWAPTVDAMLASLTTAAAVPANC